MAVTGLAGCATAAHEAGVPEDKIQVHESVTSAPPRYEIVKRLWIESWRSAFFVPSYGSAEEGAADLRSQAAALGGNGVLNFGCYRKSDAAGAPLACNGTIVRFR